MRNTVVAGAMMAVCLVGGEARADKESDEKIAYQYYLLSEDLSTAWRKGDDGKPWQVADGNMADGKAKCQAFIDELDKLGVKPDDVNRVKLQYDSPEFPAGKYTLDDVRAMCGRIGRQAKIKMWEKWAIWSMQEHAKVKAGGSWTVQYFQNCVNTYQDMLKQGIDKGQLVIPRNVNDADQNPVEWKGTVAELNTKYCVIGLKDAKAAQEKLDAPYKKVLKGDKLELALEYRGFYLVGGQVTSDPAIIAKNNVLFIDTEPSASCANGMQRHQVHRWTFDAKGKELKVENIETCGTPRARDFK